jgi:hypothetical protein
LRWMLTYHHFASTSWSLLTPAFILSGRYSMPWTLWNWSHLRSQSTCLDNFFRNLLNAWHWVFFLSFTLKFIIDLNVSLLHSQ